MRQYRVTRKPLRALDVELTDGSGNRVYPVPGHSWQFDVSPADIIGCLSLAPEDLWHQHAQLALDEFSEQIPDELSIANFAWELQDMRELIPAIGSLLQSIGPIGGRLKDFTWREAKLAFKSARPGESLARRLGSEFLNYSFNLAPLFGDVEKLRGLCSTVTARLNWLKRNYGKEVPLHYWGGRVLNQPALVEPFVEPPSEWSWGRSFRVVDRSRITRASCMLYQELVIPSDWTGMFQAYGAALGLNNPFGVVWEALPFSFVVDWVAHVGTLLHRTAPQPFRGAWEVRKACQTVSDNFTVEVGAIRPLHWSHSGEVIVTDRYAVTRYERRVGLSIPASYFSLAGLTPKQLLLATAMLT
jgi:hypothetical protein